MYRRYLPAAFPWILREVPNRVAAPIVLGLMQEAERSYGNLSSFAIDADTSDTRTYGQSVHIWMSDATKAAYLEIDGFPEQYGYPIRSGDGRGE